MRINYLNILIFLFFGLINNVYSQNESWFYIRAKSENFNPEFERIDDLLVYKGGDQKLKKIFSNYSISEFKKTYKNANKSSLKRTFFVVVNNKSLLQNLLIKAAKYFDFGEFISEEDKKIFEPNDYGLTSTIGTNKGLAVNLDYFDFVGAPQAWYYTTGSKDMIIGLSDGQVEITDKDFLAKTTVIKNHLKLKGMVQGLLPLLLVKGIMLMALLVFVMIVVFIQPIITMLKL